MTSARRRRRENDDEEAGEREREPEPAEPEEPAALDADAVAALREADPRTRARSLLALQRTHGNLVVQRLLRSLQRTDPSREVRIRHIGAMAQEAAPSGRLDRAERYRRAIEEEVDASPLKGKTERDIVLDSINTIGQVFNNYQAALHIFEAAAPRLPEAEAMPREETRRVLAKFSESVFEPLVKVGLRALPLLEEAVEAGLGVTDGTGRDLRPEPSEGPPVTALRNLVLTERTRVAGEQRALIEGQMEMVRAVEDTVVAADESGRATFRQELVRAWQQLNAIERDTHSPAELAHDLVRLWRDAARRSGTVEIVLDADWHVRRAHIRAPHGRRLAAQLVGDAGGAFDLGTLRLPRHVTWLASDVAVCEAQLDARGIPVAFSRNEKGGDFFEEFERRLRREGLPPTRALSGD